MRGFVILTVAVCAAIGIGVAASAGSTAPPQAQVTHVSIPISDGVSSITASGTTLALTGYPDSGVNAPCGTWQVNWATLALGRMQRFSCGTLTPSAQTISAVVVDPYSNETGIRIARRDPATGKVTMGPIVMRFSQSSDSNPVQMYGDGSLWVYDVATPTGDELLRVSATNGRVENTIHVPFNPVRPMLAVNDDGLWMATQVNGGANGGPASSPIYHVTAGSDVATIVHRGGYGAFWITAAGHTLWVDVPSFVRNRGGPGGGFSQELWAFQGTAARVVLHHDVSETTWQGVTMDPDGDLVAFTSPGSASENRCGPARVSIESPDSTSARTIATLPVPISNSTISCELLTQELQVATLGDAVFALSGASANEVSELWRIGPAS